MRVILRIHTTPERWILRGRRPNRAVAALGANLTWPLAMFCFGVCLWRWAYDLGWIDRFLVFGGVLFHWQVWFVGGGLLHIIGAKLAGYARIAPRDTRGAAPAPIEQPQHAHIP
jgi:hypothetical protein